MSSRETTLYIEVCRNVGLPKTTKHTNQSKTNKYYRPGLSDIPGILSVYIFTGNVGLVLFEVVFERFFSPNIFNV